MSIRVRFAPSPTGYLHIGNARTALFNYLLVCRQKGQLILRIEDTDPERSKPEYEEAIFEDLKWLGIVWDEGPDVGGSVGPYRQSQRLAIYKSHAEELVKQEKAYYCFCSPEELELRREEARHKGETPRYDNRCRDLSKEEIEAYRARGMHPVIRFKVGKGTLRFHDIIRGDVEFDLSLLSDFVILRPDGTPTFHLAVCLDDGMMQVTHVIRGEDHLSNTPRHILIFEALGFPVPQFAHMSLTLGPGGAPLSKRLGARSIREYRTLGYLPEALANYLSLLGWSPGDDREIFALDELKEIFSLERMIRSAAVFDKDKLDWVSGQHIRRMADSDYLERAKQFLAKEGDFLTPFRGRGDEWVDKTLLLFKDSIVCFSDLEDKFVFFDEKEKIEDKDSLANSKVQTLLSEALAFLEKADAFDENTFSAMVETLKKKTTLKGKAFYSPLRLAFTGRKEGPELVSLFPLLGKELCVKRLKDVLGK